MKTVQISLNSIDKVKSFVNIHAEDNVEQILEALSPYIIK